MWGKDSDNMNRGGIEGRGKERWVRSKSIMHVCMCEILNSSKRRN